MAQNENKKATRDQSFEKSKGSYSSQAPSIETPDKPERWQSDESDLSDTDEDEISGTTQSFRK